MITQNFEDFVRLLADDGKKKISINFFKNFISLDGAAGGGGGAGGLPPATIHVTPEEKAAIDRVFFFFFAD